MHTVLISALGHSKHALQRQTALIAKGFAVHTPNELILIKQRQRKVAIAAFCFRYVAFNLIIEVEQRLQARALNNEIVERDKILQALANPGWGWSNRFGRA